MSLYQRSLATDNMLMGSCPKLNGENYWRKQLRNVETASTDDVIHQFLIGFVLRSFRIDRGSRQEHNLPVDLVAMDYAKALHWVIYSLGQSKAKKKKGGKKWQLAQNFGHHREVITRSTCSIYCFHGTTTFSQH